MPTFPQRNATRSHWTPLEVFLFGKKCQFLFSRTLGVLKEQSGAKKPAVHAGAEWRKIVREEFELASLEKKTRTHTFAYNFVITEPILISNVPFFSRDFEVHFN